MKYVVIESGILGGTYRKRGEIVEAGEGDPYGYARHNRLAPYTEEPPVAKVAKKAPRKTTTKKGKR